MTEPSKPEIETLLSLGKHHLAALRAVEKLLADQHSPYQVDFVDVDGFENDIAQIEKLSKSQICYADLEYFTELCAVMKGQPSLIVRGNGELYDAGYTFDNVKLTMLCAMQPGTINSVTSHADTWSADITWSVREREAKEAEADEKAIAEMLGEEYEPATAPISSTSIDQRETSDIKLAVEHGQEVARNNGMQALRDAHYVK